MRRSPRIFHRTPSHADKMYALITVLIVNACIAGTIPATPENITVTFLTPTTVRVSWQTSIDLNAHPVEKYIVTYKPTDDRVVQDVAGNAEAVILDRLSPSTQYSIAVTAIWLGKKYRSRQIIFRTLDMPRSSSQMDFAGGAAAGVGNGAYAGNPGSTGYVGNLSGRATNGSIYGDDITSTATNTFSHGKRRELPTVRGVEIGIVLIVLMVWAGAIALFFNRWGKIRMLLPYQPDYKHEQLKVPGTGVCSGGVCNGQHSHQKLHPEALAKFDSTECGAYQPVHCNTRHFHMLQEERSTSISDRCTRSRINSAIFVSSDGRGFDSIEFLRRHGSQSVLCRKAKSAENITENGRKKSFSDKRRWRTDEGDETVATAEDVDSEGIEMKECRVEPSTSAGPACATSVFGHSAAVTTANVVVGSISIETPPAYMKEDIKIETNPSICTKIKVESHPRPRRLSMLPDRSTSRDSNDTVEELILVPTETRARVLVHQRSSSASSKERSQSPGLSSAHSTPKTLILKGAKPKISALPMVSVSGPSPQDEKPPPAADCL